jgi:hypothetical protein
MKYLLYSVLLVALVSSCTSAPGDNVLLDVRRITNKTPQEVESVLGAPDTTYTLRVLGKQIFCQKYLKNNVEIQYPDSVSSDIVVYGPHGLPFNQTSLKAFNLPHAAKHPSQYIRGTLMRWYDFGEFEAISFYNVQKDSVGNPGNFNVYFKAKPIGDRTITSQSVVQ